jgi:hypothetical protein
VNVSILLLDADDHPTTDDSRDIELLLTSSLGELETRTPKILRGTFSAETTLTSARHGTAHISASAVGLDGGTGQAVFTFPWLMTGLAVAGGIAGSFARQTGSRGRKKLTPHLIIGAIFGLAFYALVMLGAVASVPKFSIAIGNIATVNELGALVLGLIGGYGGKHLWEHLTSA